MCKLATTLKVRELAVEDQNHEELVVKATGFGVLVDRFYCWSGGPWVLCDHGKRSVLGT